MTIQKLISVFFLQLLCVHVFLFDRTNAQSLRVGFYNGTCPSIEEIVKNTTASFISQAPLLAPALLRMHFHDCFVRGCDGSVLINSTTGNQAEKDAIPNQSLRGFEVIDAVKSAVENICPSIVSCADILALVARDAVTLLNGPSWQVPLGRRDGRVSISSEALANLPPPFANITQLKASFRSKGLSDKELAILSGGHTIGISHCSSFSNRLYNFTGQGDTDPSLDPNYIVQLRQMCSPTDTTSNIEMDPGSATTFDTSYYTLVRARRGLFEADAALLNDNATRNYVLRQANSSVSNFFKDFAASMVKMGKIGVTTGNRGEIRTICSAIN
ncbi:peroxidase 27-like [Olea europaea var. sylvestris]|uniref:Peroxidase n=1 Tax=Olea europaea subsp. europaea TaxID=158383 RepID=A0A8S0USA0_OLEEU|nr:peroxidase 27-like [Olea europaea var. sylvestris]CAA3020694.1 peroxidase 27-like [Olea europaea subsp. europaea]